jgi:signal transduction histidine kinase
MRHGEAGARLQVSVVPGEAALIVDDDPQVVRTIAMALASRGVASLTAYSVAEARAMLASEPTILAVVSDINMPSGSGLELADTLPADGDHAGAVELVFMTGDGSKDAVVEALRRKASDFLTKPFRMSELADTVARAIARARARRERGERAASVDRQVREAREIGDRLAEHLTRSLRALADTRAALNRAEEVRANLFAVISHELRTPLIPILGFADLMLANPELSAEDRRRMLGSIRDEGRRLLTLIETALDILALQQPDALRLAPEASIDAVVALAIEDAGARVAEARASLRIEGAGGAADCDPDRLRRAVAALLDNAAKASPPGGEIVVTLDRGDAAVTVAVRDHGPGAGGGMADALGLPFLQGDMSTTRAWPGAGLGLAFVTRVAAAHRGRFALSDAEDGGALARLTLPLSQG